MQQLMIEGGLRLCHGGLKKPMVTQCGIASEKTNLLLMNEQDIIDRQKVDRHGSFREFFEVVGKAGVDLVDCSPKPFLAIGISHR